MIIDIYHQPIQLLIQHWLWINFYYCVVHSWNTELTADSLSVYVEMQIVKNTIFCFILTKVQWFLKSDVFICRNEHIVGIYVYYGLLSITVHYKILNNAQIYF